MNDFQQNQKELQRIVETEVDVSVEKDGDILTGKIDLLMGSDGQLELLDFKISPRPVDSPELLRRCEQQLCTYAHILERRHGKRVERLVLYWTAEENKANAIMERPCRPEMVEEAGRHFDEVVVKIEANDFHILTPPGKQKRDLTDQGADLRRDSVAVAAGDTGSAERKVGCGVARLHDD